MKCMLVLFLTTWAIFYTEAAKLSSGNVFSKFVNDKCSLDRDRSNYSGKESVTLSGHSCEAWNSIPKERFPYSDLSNCRHNYCRNPNGLIQPWCFIKKRHKYKREYCDISKKPIKPTTPQATTEPLKQDTELTCGERRVERLSKIIGGLRSTAESQPWIATIFKGSGFMCGGTLIAPCWVLTAAHCFPQGKTTQVKRYSVSLGKNAINETDSVREQHFKVIQLVVHEGFDYTTENYNNDIALLKIESSDGQCAMKTKHVRTACLPPFQQMLPTGFYCEIAGYGRYQKGGFEYSRHLKQAQVKLISHNTCKQDYQMEEVNENMFCAAGREWSEDACQGDSGGPLMCEVNNTLFLFGVISWGKDCAESSSPGVYTKVTNYNRWISNHTGLATYTAGSRYPQKD